MKVGVGLPNAVPATPSTLLLEWMEKAEQGPFSSLGVVDRIAYDSHEPLSVLAAAAARTKEIGLVAMIVIGPLRNTGLLAKSAATIDQLSGGRLTLGLAVGARHDDYDVLGIDHRGRGARFTNQLIELREHWEKGEIGPHLERHGGPPILVGGSSDAAFARLARYADGYVHGGGPPRTFERASQRVHAAWREVGRENSPLMWAQGYFALGDAARNRGMAYMRNYYAFTGPFADKIAAGLLCTPQSVIQFIQGYEDAGCQELVLLPAVSEVDQIDRLADVISR